MHSGSTQFVSRKNICFENAAMYYNLSTFCPSVGLFFFITYSLTFSNFVVSQNVLIDAVCNRTTFADDCRELMYSDSRSAHINMLHVGYIAINLTKHYAVENLDYIEGELEATKQPQVKKVLGKWQAVYLVLWYDLLEARDIWTNRNILGVKSIATERINAILRLRKLNVKDMAVLNECMIFLLQILEAACDVALLPNTHPIMVAKLKMQYHL